MITGKVKMNENEIVIKVSAFGIDPKSVAEKVNSVSGTKFAFEYLISYDSISSDEHTTGVNSIANSVPLNEISTRSFLHPDIV